MYDPVVIAADWLKNSRDQFNDKMKNKKWHTVGTVPISNRNIAERGKINPPNTQIRDCSIYWIGTGTSIKVAVVKRV
jgi:hypothetical protein